MPDIFTSNNTPSHAAGASEGTHHKHQVSSHKMPSVEELKKSPGYNAGGLSSYCYYPKKINFFNKDKEEKVVLLLRKHPITNIPWLFISGIMFAAPLFVDILPFFASVPVNFQVFGILLWYLLVFAFSLEQFLTWFFNVNIITDERLFDVDFINLLYRQITDANLDQIQDVTVKIGSVVRTIFNYGDVHIQTAGNVAEIEFEAVPNPDRVAKILRELRVEEEIEKIEGRIR